MKAGTAMAAPWLLGFQALAFWPVLGWYGSRMAEPGEEAWGITGLLAAAWVVYKGRSGAEGQGIRGVGIGWAPVTATCAYAAAFPWLSPLPRAILALIALACLLPSLGLRPRAVLHAAGFLFLSLPIMPSLQFYLGYPLRILSGETAARLLNLAGIPAVREGAMLNWRDHAVFIDAPCSGVKMLWAGMMLAWALSALRGMGPWRTAGMAGAAFGAVVAGNILRTTALFFLETGAVRAPAWAHSAVGVAGFAAVAGLIAWQGKPPRNALSASGRPACAG